MSPASSANTHATGSGSPDASADAGGFAAIGGNGAALEEHWQQVWQAIRCHRSQLPGYEALLHITEEQHRYLWGCQEFYRAFSLVTAGRAVEDDLFAGLR
jgi:hypothetical protein